MQACKTETLRHDHLQHKEAHVLVKVPRQGRHNEALKRNHRCQTNHSAKVVGNVFYS